MPHDIIVIGGSMGAFEVLQTICANLSPDVPAAVLVATHVGSHGHDLIAGMLDRTGPLPASTAEDGMEILPGHIYVAPADAHLLVVGSMIRLGRGPRENMSRPAVDPLFRSAALSHGPRVIGLVLTGMLNDGASGLAAVKACGGIAVVQNPADAKADEMPLGALEACDVDYRASAPELGPLLDKLARENPGRAMPAPRGLALEVDIALGRPCNTPTLAQIANPIALSCPSCGGVLSVMNDDNPLRLRCQVGHGFTAKALAAEQEGSTDEALRVALRIVEERATLATRMAKDDRLKGRTGSAELLEARVGELRIHAETIRETLIREAAHGGRLTIPEL
jgi:two-component system chemotaxis response regulator CheB